MNKTHRLVWNDRTRLWVAAAEHVRARGRRSGAALRLAAGLLPAVALAQPAPQALPSGGQVVAGQAQIRQDGAALTIDQASTRAAIDWQQFDVGAAARVQFRQPSSRAVTLNRVQGPDASRIFGRIDANGQVFLSNPNGVYFAPGASVDVAGLVATTHRISLDDFMAGRTRFERQGATGSVVNEGELRAALGGYIALLAPEVRNQGVVVANLGTVAMAAGEAFELRFDARQSLTGLRVEPGLLRALVDNRGAVLAPGGLVILSAQALDRVQGGVVRNSGRIEAMGLAERGGRIVLEASSEIAHSGSLRADATADGPAGSVRLTAPTVVNSGSITASGSTAHPQGGTVEIEAHTVTQTAGGAIDASGPRQGGTVRIRAAAQVELAGRVVAQAPSEPRAAAAATAPEAPSAQDIPTRGGSISIEAAQISLPSATLEASGGQGGSILLDTRAPAPALPWTPPTPAPTPAPEPGKLALLGSTQLSARGRRGHGGELTLLGDHLGLRDHTVLDASGATGGGSVRVGGGWQGQGGWYQATTVTMAEGVRIDASATQRGDGGSVVLWSDVHRADGLTLAAGSLRARGGAQGGHGGRIETSGHAVDTQGLRVDAGSAGGVGGLWLIDPYNYTIGSTQAATIAGTLNTGTSVTVTTSANNAGQGSSGNAGDAGNITLTSTIGKTAGGDATLTLQAHGDIVFTGAGVTSSAGKLNLVLVADWDAANGGAIWLNGSGTPITVATQGGHVWMGGNGYATASGSASWNGLAVGTGLANSTATTSVYEGVNLNRTTVDTGGGNVFVAGHNARYNSGEARLGVLVGNGSSVTTGAGSITLQGTLQALNGALGSLPSLYGVHIDGASLSSTTGAITITGGETAAGDYGNFTGFGVRLFNASVGSTAGDIAITGTVGVNNASGESRDGIQLRASGANARTTVSSTSGNITLTGTSYATNTAAGSGISLMTSKPVNDDANHAAVKVVSQTGQVLLVGDSPNNSHTGSNGIYFSGTNYGRFYIGQDETGTHSGDVTLTGRSVNEANMAAGYLRLLGSGALTIQPTGSSFVRGAATGASNDFGANWSFGSGHSAITLGKDAAGAKSDTLSVSTALTAAGPIRLYAGTLALNADLTSTLSGAAILAKASGNISSNANRSFQTRNGDLAFWSNAGNGGTAGALTFGDSNSFNTANGSTSQSSGGGRIVMAGGLDDGSNGGTAGDGVPDGFASSASASGIGFGSSGTAGTTSLYSGGGNILMRGSAMGGSQLGIHWNKTGTVVAGNGTVGLTGTSSQGHGIELGAHGGSTSIRAGGGDATQAAIRVVGTSTSANNAGVQTNGGSLQATGSGGITVDGSAVNSSAPATDIGVDVLAVSGAIAIGANGPGGLRYGGTLGRKAATAVTASSSSVTLTGDTLVVNNAVAVDTSGRVTVQPDGNDFSSPLVWPVGNFSLAGTVSGLTLGKDVPGVAKTDTITINAAQTIAGPIAVYGGAVNVNAALTAAGDITLVSSGTDADLLINVAVTSTAAGTSNLLLKSARNVSLAAGGSITAAGGPLNTQFWADADRSGDGINRLLSNIDTRGGWLKFGNDEFATINGVSTRVGGDVFINGSVAQTIATGGGQFDLFGEAILANTAGLTISTAGGNVNFYGVLNSGNTYTYVDKTGSAGSGSWTAARTEARNGTAGGAAVGDSFLVTIGSRLENALASLAAGYRGAWIGAWRPNPTGSFAWTWADGPDAGQNFFDQNSSGGGGSAVAGRFHNFDAVEPNGTLAGNESVGQFFGNAGRWNDLSPTTTYSATQSSPYAVLGFVRETNLANSPLTINAGSGAVTLHGGVGGSKALASLNVQAASTTINGNTLLTSGAQSYDNTLTVNSSGELTVGATAITVTQANQGALFKAAGNVSVNAATAITTNNGDLQFWSNAGNASTAGALVFGGSHTFNTANGATHQATGGGRILMAGGLDDGSNGGTAGDGIADGFASSATAAGIALGPAAAGSTTTTLISGGGDIVMRGNSTQTGGTGVSQNQVGALRAGNGTVSITGTATGGHGVELGAYTGGSTTIVAGGGDANRAAIAISGTSTASSSYAGLQTNAGSMQATGAGGIRVTGTGSSSNYSANNLGLDALAASGPIEITAVGGTGLRYLGTLGRKSATSVTASSSDVTLTANALTVNTGITVDTTGMLTLQPYGSSFSSALAWPIANLNVLGMGGLTLGKAGNTADITLGSAVSVNGPVALYGGNLALNAGLTATGNTVLLAASGTVSDGASGFVSAANLRLQGGNVTLDSAGNTIGTVAASGVGALTLRNSGALTIGTVGGTSGIAASGAVDVSTESGDLTLAASVATSATGADAIVLNAGRAAAAGAAAGGNLIVGGSPAITTGAGGRATLYSGSVAGSTGLTALVGSGSGRFRYNSDEGASNFVTALGSGLHAVYRERPVVALGWTHGSMVYGDTQPASSYTVTGGSLVNGDAPSASVAGAVLSGAGRLAVSGSPYAVQDSGALQALGYDATVSHGSLTVTPRTLTASLTGVDKVYDGGLAATVTLGDDRVAGDGLSLSYGSAGFLDKQAGAGKTVNVSGLTLTGADAGNYTLAATSGSTTAAITPRGLSVIWTGIDKGYDGTAVASVDSSDDRVGGDVLTVTRTAAFADADAGNGKTVHVTGVSLSGADALNYSVAATGSTTAAITPKTLTLSAIKVYDGSTALGAGSISFGGLVGSQTLAYSGATASNAHVATAGKFVSSITLLDGSDGGLAANYVLPTLNAANAPVTITPKAITATAAIGGTTSKVYDGTAAATGATVVGIVSGAIAGDTLALDASGLTLAYDSAHVVGATQVAASGSTGFTIGGSASGSQASDYSFTGPGIAAVAGSITPKALTAAATIGGTTTKVYDGTTAATGATVSGSVSGAIAGDTLALDVSGVALAYDSAHVIGATQIGASGSASLTIGTSPSGSQASDYGFTAPVIAAVAGSITPRTVTVTGLAAGDKVYDGTRAAALTDIGSLSGLVNGEGLGLSVAQANFDSADAGTGKTVTASGYLLSSGRGGLASDYQLASTSATTTADISKAVLTVIANNDARFVAQADVPGFSGVSYSGFVRNETAAVLGGTVTVVRTNPGENLAGYYAGVLVPDTRALSSGNYSFQTRNGDFGIVPAGQLLLRVAPTTTAYGNAPTYTLTSAQYLDHGNVIHSATITPSGGARFTVEDGVGGSATLRLVPAQAGTSSAGWTTVGAWQLSAVDVVTRNASNFSNTLTVVGAETVVPRAVDASASGGVSKVYDGTVSMANLALQLSGAEAADRLLVSGGGRFASKNAGSNLAYTVTGLTLSGADAGNYYLTDGGTFSGSNGSITPRSLTVTYAGVNKVYDGSSAATVGMADDRIPGDSLSVQVAAAFDDKNVGTGKRVTVSGATLGGADAGNYTLTATGGSTTADITRLNSVTWTGGATGDWFDPANWAGGAVPDLANVAGVVIPAGVVVRFDTAGAVAPARTGPVQLDSLGGAGGGLVQNDGALNVGGGGITLGSLAQNGGSLASGGPIVVDDFSQTGGSTRTQGDLTVTGNFAQGPNGTLAVQGDARITDTRGDATLGNLQTGGLLEITSSDGGITQQPGTVIVVGGTTTLDAGAAAIRLDGPDNDFQGPFNASGGRITVADGTGGLVLGQIDAGGDFSATSTGGAITQAPGTAIVVDGTTTVDAGTDAIRLDGPANDFQGPFNASGGRITVVDGTGGLVLGQIDAGGDFSATSTGGAITQAPGSSLTVNGSTTLDAGSAAIVLDAPGNNFVGPVNAIGGDITLVDGEGGLTLGKVTAGGTLLARSLDGDLTQAAGTTITVAGRATLDASTGVVRLAGAGNQFAGGLVLPGTAAARDAEAVRPVPPVVPPSALPSPLGAPPPLIDVSAARAGVRLSVAPSAAANGSATLTAGVPERLLASGFSFELPAELVPDAAADASLVATLADGSPLPPWLRFERERRRFVADAVPPGGLPLRLVVTAGARSTVVVLAAQGS